MPYSGHARHIASLDRCHDPDALLGIEGTLAATYFQHFSTMLQAGPVRDAFSPACRNRRRSRVAKRLLDYGERVQYSVFCCQLNPRELHRLQQDLKKEINCDEDQTLFVDAGAVAGEHPIPDLTYLGRAWRPESRTQVV